MRGGDNPNIYQLIECPKGNLFRLKLQKQEAKEIDYTAYISRADLPSDIGFYKFSFFIKTNLEQGTAGFRIVSRKNNKNKVLSISGDDNNFSYFTGTTDWKEIETTYKVKDSSEQIILQLETINSLGEVLFGGISITKLPQNSKSEFRRNKEIIDKNAVKIGVPFHLVNPLGAELIYNPYTKKNEIAINNSIGFNEEHQGSAIFVDYENKQSRSTAFPVGSGGWGLLQSKNKEQIYFESIGSPSLYAVNIKNYEINKHLSFDFGNRLKGGYFWNMVEYGNYIFLGSYGNSSFYKFNKLSREIKEITNLSQNKNNIYTRQMAINRGGWIVFYIGYDSEESIAYNLENDVKIKLKYPIKNLKCINGTIYGNLQKNKNDRIVTFSNQSKTIKELSYSCPDNSYWKQIIPSMRSEEFLLKSAVNKLYLINEKNNTVKLLDKVPPFEGNVIGMDINGKLIGVNNQCYFIIDPTLSKITTAKISDISSPVPILFLKQIPTGGIIGGSSVCQALFLYDEDHPDFLHSPNLTNFGQIYDGVWKDDVFYFACYSSGELKKWQPNLSKGKTTISNVASFNTKEHFYFTRPNGGVVLGPEGNIYTGWSSGYGKKIGGVSSYNPVDKSIKSWSLSDIADDLSIGQIDADGEHIYGTSSKLYNGTKSKKDAPYFWVLNPKKDEFVYFTQLIGNNNTPFIIVDEKLNCVWIADDKGIVKYKDKKLSNRIYYPIGSGKVKIDGLLLDKNIIYLLFKDTIYTVNLIDSKPYFHEFYSSSVKIHKMEISQNKLFFSSFENLFSLDLN